MIASADDDPIRPSDLATLFLRAAQLPQTRDTRHLIARARAGDGVAIERLARRVESP